MCIHLLHLSTESLLCAHCVKCMKLLHSEEITVICRHISITSDWILTRFGVWSLREMLYGDFNLG
jgi:hypothetical protein